MKQKCLRLYSIMKIEGQYKFLHYFSMNFYAFSYSGAVFISNFLNYKVFLKIENCKLTVLVSFDWLKEVWNVGISIKGSHNGASES